MPPKEPQILSFATPEKFRDWLAQNHTSSEGIWLRVYKKASGKKFITQAQALDEALCFGWIDAQAKPQDAESWIQRFCPRRKNSNWSKRNTQYAERLIESGKMTAAGLAEINAAKADGRWEAAYESPANATIPEDFLKRVANNKKAQAFFNTLNKTNLYSIAYRLQTAKKPETREKRMDKILEMLANGQKFH